jgi:hypothetical protein
MLTAVGLVVAVNAFVLVRVAQNRAGEPDAELRLTERELPVAFSSRDAESSAVALRIEVDHFGGWYQRRTSDLNASRWLDATKLAELGFDVRLPANATDAAVFLSRQLMRTAFAAIEFQGPAWSAYHAALENQYGEGAHASPPADSWEIQMARRELQGGSRLFIVDAGREPAALRKRYPDRSRYLILPANVRAYLDQDGNGGECSPGACRASGSISLLINEVVVPRRLHAGLPVAARMGQGPSEVHEPRYEVTLQVGVRHEPWVQSARSLQ